MNDKRGDVETKFRAEGMNGNGAAAGGKAHQNGNSHAGAAGACYTHIEPLKKMEVLTTMSFAQVTLNRSRVAHR